MSSFFSFLASLFTDGAKAFDRMDNFARVSDSSPLVHDVTSGLDTVNSAFRGSLDAVVHPAKRILTDLDLQADWQWFKTILADIAILLVVGLASLLLLYIIG